MIKGVITGQTLKLKDVPLIVSDSIDYLEAVFAFRSKDWEECEKWAHFSQGDVVYDIKLTDNKIRKEDHLNLGSGSWKIYLHGASETGMRITTDPVAFGVKKSGVLNGQPLPKIPLSVAENFDLRISFLEELGGYPSGVSPYIVNEAKGEAILLIDSAKAKLRGLKLYGKSTQDGTPTPEIPVEIVSAGADGDIVVTIDGETPQTLTALPPNGLPGIKVASGGNYKDSTNQQWLCDEIDFGRGVYVQRCIIGDSSKLTLNYEYENCNRYEGIIFSDKVLGELDMTKGVGLCNFVAKGSWSTKDEVHYFYSHNSVNVWLPKTLDLETIKANIVFMGILQTPIETPLTEEEMAQYAALHTNYPTTTATNNAGVDMKVSYVADTKNYIDKKFNEMAAAIVAKA